MRAIFIQSSHSFVLGWFQSLFFELLIIFGWCVVLFSFLGVVASDHADFVRCGVFRSIFDLPFLFS